MKSIKYIIPIILLSFFFTSCSQAQVHTQNELSVNDIKSDSFWKSKLSEEQYFILREKGTEKPYSGKWLLNKDTGYYTCSACGNALFKSDQKFDSHCGWPSFDEQIESGKITTKEDNTHGMTRTEILCSNCGGHLGHLFNDGPTETGKRYCVNSVSIDFVSSLESNKSEMDTITLGGGCFWCIEAIFERLNGVVSVQSGYSGGHTENPSYESVCSGATNHAEVVQIVYNTTQVSLLEILKVFFSIHDPSTLNQQGADIGTQYRSIIFYRNDAQKTTCENIVTELNQSKIYDSPVVTQVEAFKTFYVAEVSHQDYYANNQNKSYCQVVIQPKLEKFEKLFKSKIKSK